MRFNPPPGWPTPPAGWAPPEGWRPDPSWPDPPEGWLLWLPDTDTADGPGQETETQGPGDPALDQPRTQLPESAQAPSPQQDAPSAPTEHPDQAGASGQTSTAAPAPAAPATATPAPAAGGTAALLARIADLEAALAAAHAGDGNVIELNDQRVLQDVGIYRYHHPLEDAAAYKDRLRALEADIDDVVKAGNAVLAADMFTFGGSLAKGRKMTNDLGKLMLRAYNAEADNCVRSLRSGNIATATKRLDRAMQAIEKLGAIMEMRVNPDYHALRVAELELTADYQMKVQEEREQAREEREQLREQKRAEQELAAERERLDKERAHYVTVLESLRASGDNAAADELAARLGEIEQAIEANDYRIANIRAGYVYVISNVGTFGPNVVKIGMTRRLEPRDRIRELGDASVPFLYDVHALFFSEDAISLENQLHKTFAERRVNHVNLRREFFFATPEEVREVLAEKVGGLLEYNDTPAAPEYFQSKGSWPAFD